MIALAEDRMADLRTAVALLNLPVRLDTDGPTVVVHMPADLDTFDEVHALMAVRAYTDDFRREVLP